MNYSQVAIVQAHTDTHTHTTGGPAEPTDADETTPACGWFDSSWELRQGLAVTELPDSDGTVAALWFAALAATGPQGLVLQ